MTTISRRRFVAWCAGAGAGLLAAGCASAPNAQPAPPATAAPAAPTTAAAPAAAAAPTSPPAAAAKPTSAPAVASGGDVLKVGVGTTVASSGVFIGVDRGYYKELNLTIQQVPFPGGAADMAAPLASGQIDVAGADPSSAFLNAIARGIDVKFVADSGHTDEKHSPAALVVRKQLIDSGAIADFPDLRGHKISGVIKGSLVDSWVHRFLDKGGLRESDVDLQYLGFPDNIPAMANGALDAAVLVEPLITAAVGQNIGVRWKGVGETFGPLQNTVIMYGANLVNDRPEVAKRFMVGYLHAVRDYVDAFENNQGKSDVIQILVNNTTIKDPSVYEKIALGALDLNGRMVVSNMKDLQQWLVDNGYVQTPVDLDKVVDYTYADYAVSQLGRR
jgi:NitT/TauT family transport system substrate-binding protein